MDPDLREAEFPAGRWCGPINRHPYLLPHSATSEVTFTCFLVSEHLARSSSVELLLTRAAFARPGPSATKFPDVTAPMPLSDSLVPSSPRSGSPRVTSTLVQASCSSRPAPRACWRAGLGERGHRRPRVAGKKAREDRGSPGLPGHPCETRRRQIPRRVRRPLAQSRGRRCCFQEAQGPEHTETS